MVISVEEFKKYIRHIKDVMKKDDDLTKILVAEDTTGWVAICPELIDDVIDLVYTGMGIEDKMDWIEWWLWEVGDGACNCMWCDYNGERYKFVINDEEDLYYLILDDLDRIKEKAPSDEEDEQAFNDSVQSETSDIFEAFKDALNLKESNN